MADKNSKGSPKKGSPKKESPTKANPSPKKSPSEESKPVSEVKNEPVPSTSSADSPTGSEGQTTPVSESGDNSWGGWFTRTLSTATERSTEMFNYLKQDLTEFSETVQEAGREIKDKLNLDNVEDTVKSAVTTVGSKANVILEQVSTIFGIGPDDDDEELVMGKQSVRNKMYTMMYDESLFLEDPKDLEEYDSWMSHFDLEQENDEIVNLLGNNANLQEHYTKLVPSKVSHLVFWHRFFYLVHVMLEAEKKAAACSTQPVSSISPADTPTLLEECMAETVVADVEESLDPSLVEISEEDQKRLLAEYEEEMKKCDEESGHNSRRSSGPLSSSSSSSFAFVTLDGVTDEVKVE